MTVLKLQERITTLELEKDDLEQYGRRVCVRIDDVLVESEETADSVYEKVGEFFREACPDIPVSCIDRAHRIGSEYKSNRRIATPKKYTLQLFVNNKSLKLELFPTLSFRSYSTTSLWSHKSPQS